jgi:hypothetical protein
MLASRRRTVAFRLESSSSTAVTFLHPIVEMTCLLCCVLVSCVGSKPMFVSCCSAVVMCGLGLFSAMRCMPAFSKKGLYRAMTATVSTFDLQLQQNLATTPFELKKGGVAETTLMPRVMGVGRLVFWLLRLQSTLS